jgi:hypothetical protein
LPSKQTTVGCLLGPTVVRLFTPGGQAASADIGRVTANAKTAVPIESIFIASSSHNVRMNDAKKYLKVRAAFQTISARLSRMPPGSALAPNLMTSK